MKRTAAVVMMALVIPLSGCPMWADLGGSINFTGELNASVDHFRMNGTLLNSGQVSPPPEFSNVTIYLYRSDGSLIRKKNVGTLKSKTRVSIQTKEVPRYVIIYSEEFWEYDEITVSYFKLIDDVYAEYGVASRSELPVMP